MWVVNPQEKLLVFGMNELYIKIFRMSRVYISPKHRKLNLKNQFSNKRTHNPKG